MILFIVINTKTVIFNRAGQINTAILVAFGFNDEVDFSVFRIFNRIADEVHENLPNTAGITRKVNALSFGMIES